MKIKLWPLGIIILAAILGGVAITSAAGIWRTENSKQPALYADNKLYGQYNPADIRGSYTFTEISSLFDIPMDDLLKGFSIDESQYSLFKCKDLESKYKDSIAEGREVSTDSVRIFTALYKGLPITLNNSTYLPKPAVDILLDKAVLSDEQKEFLKNHIAL